jgi:drug/metabolite transporter (DMT)-like permease
MRRTAGWDPYHATVGQYVLQHQPLAPAVSTTATRRRIAAAFVCLVLSAIAMGASPIFVRLADVGPYASAFWRTFLALPLLWVWSHIEVSRGSAPPAFDRSVLLAGLVFAGDLFFWHLAIVNTTVANATFLATTTPIWVALGAWLLAIETIGGRTLAGLALCLVGGTALVGQSYGFAPHRVLGDVFGIVTAVFFGSYMLAVRWARRRHAPGRLLFLSTMVTTPCLFMVALAMEPRLLPQSAGGLAALLALALISHVGGQGLASIALGTLPATFSSLVIFIEAIAAAVLGWLILGEQLGPVQAVGGVLILVGILVARPRSAASAIRAAGP